MAYRTIMIFFLWIVGLLFIVGGLWGIGNLFQNAKTYVQTTGEVKEVCTRKVYRYRKIRYKQEMTVGYTTGRFGELYTTVPSYYPFRKAGDRLLVWYHPERPREICFPISEGCFWGGFLLGGLLSVGGGIWSWKKNITDKLYK